MENIKCDRCGKTYKESGFQNHLTRAHGMEMWKEQEAARAARKAAAAK